MNGSTEPAGSAGDGPRRIGEVFVELGFVTGAQLDAALDLQRRKGGRLGEILIEQGSMTRLDLASALTEYWEPAVPERRRSLSLSAAGQDDPADGLAERLACLDDRLGELDAVRSADAAALGMRLHGTEAALATLERRFDAVLELVGRLRDELDAVAGRPTIEHPAGRVRER